MKHLERPELGITAKEIYNTCVRDFSDLSRVENLLTASDQVEIDSRNYDVEFPNHLLELGTNDPVMNGISKEDMINVYKQKFAPVGSIGRRFYDVIMAQADLGICPICGVRTVSNLDHFLPKTNYATLVVTPSNLVPSCRDCNADKNSYSFTSLNELPIHPYYDNIDESKWLFATPHSNKTISYEIHCPDNWSQQLRKRTKRSFALYKLGALYSKKAGQEIAEQIRLWQGKLNNSNDDQELLGYLRDQLESIEVYQNNSWRAALYAGMIANIDIVLGWLR